MLDSQTATLNASASLRNPVISATDVAVRQLSHTYPDGRRVLSDISFSVCRGERVAIVGPNGAGKTTLFLRLCGVLAGRPGEVKVCDLDPADPRQRRLLPSTIGVIFQNPDDQLFAATLLEDVAFGPLNQGHSTSEARKIAESALARVGLPGSGERTPTKLSGGEKRRAAIAGVLAMNPRILLLDEPSIFLDPRGRRELIELLNGLDGTLIIASHDLDFVLETCSRVIVLENGQIMAEGPTVETLSDPVLMDRHGLEVPGLLRRQS